MTAGRDSGQEGSSATRLEFSFCSDLMSAEGRQQQQQRVPPRPETWTTVMEITGTPLPNPDKFYSNCVEVLISSLKI